MNALEHLQEIPMITPKTKGEVCLEIMLDLGCFELPVQMAHGLGKVNLEDVLMNRDTIIEPFVERGFPMVYVHNHLLDIMRILRASDSDCCAVVDHESKFLGIITKSMVLNRLSHATTVDQPGAILVVEMVSYQYSSSELTQIVEGENAQVIGLWLESVEDSSRIRVNLKLNTSNAERIVNSLNRYKYEVIAIFGDQDYHQNVDQRFKSLMKYLDL